MKTIVLFCLIGAVACSPARQVNKAQGAATSSKSAASSTAPTRVHANSEGEPFALRFETGLLDFCDNKGSKKLDLKTGQTTGGDFVCNKEEPNSACSGFPLDISVRSPMSEPNDVVDVGGSSFPIHGRVHDCAVDGKNIAIVTASTVRFIDVATDKAVEVSPHGGERVAIGLGWVAWTEGTNVNGVTGFAPGSSSGHL
jgi:hypothetical protein